MMKTALKTITQTARRCAVCGADESQPHFRSLVKCDHCGMIFYPNGVSFDEARELYSESYFSGEEYFDYLKDRRVHEANFRRNIRTLRKPIPEGASIFEIGCSYGLFLNLARQHWKVAGCDISQEACRYAAETLGLDVVNEDFLQVDLPSGEIDAFFMWDTIEHLDDPAGYVERIHELLPAGGVLALTTGDIGSFLARKQGPNWRQIHPPTHLWYFSVETMQKMLNRFGFEVLQVRHVGMSRSMGQIV